MEIGKELSESKPAPLFELSNKVKMGLIIGLATACIGGVFYIHKRLKPQRIIKQYNHSPRKKKPRKYYRILKKRTKKKVANSDK